MRETVILEHNDIKVTTTRVTCGPDTFALSGVTAVKLNIICKDILKRKGIEGFFADLFGSADYKWFYAQVILVRDNSETICFEQMLAPMLIYINRHKEKPENGDDVEIAKKELWARLIADAIGKAIGQSNESHK